jgi:hypothetical protein
METDESGLCYAQFACSVPGIDVQFFSRQSVLHNAAFGELYVRLAAKGNSFRKKKSCTGVCWCHSGRVQSYIS